MRDAFDDWRVRRCQRTMLLALREGPLPEETLKTLAQIADMRLSSTPSEIVRAYRDAARC